MILQPSRLPSEDECLQILRESGAYDLFIDHLRRVERVANAVCVIAKNRGLSLDAELVSVAALLHDVAKHRSKGNHGKEGGDYLRSRGLPVVAEVVQTHCPDVENLRSGRLVPKTIEQKIVFYADMRVNPGRIVTLEERFAYIRECYPQAESVILELYTFARQIEWELLGDMKLGGVNDPVLLHAKQSHNKESRQKTRERIREQQQQSTRLDGKSRERMRQALACQQLK